MSDTQSPETAGDQAPDVGQEASGGSTTGSSSEKDSVHAELRLAQKQLRQMEKEIRTYRKEREERQQAEMTELEKWKAKAEEHERLLSEERNSRLQDKKLSAFRLAAQSAGVVNVDAAAKLADFSLLDIDESGEVVGVNETMKALQSSYDFLFQSAAAPPVKGGGNPANGAPSLTPADISKMDAKQYAEFKAKVLAGKIKPR